MFGGKRNNYFRYSWKCGRGHFQKFVQFRYGYPPLSGPGGMLV